MTKISTRFDRTEARLQTRLPKLVICIGRDLIARRAQIFTVTCAARAGEVRQAFAWQRYATLPFGFDHRDISLAL
jgi:hypothetical protein